MKAAVVTAAALLLAAMAHAQEARPAAAATHTFGLSLMTGQNNELFTFFTVKEHDGKVVEARPITRGRFVLEASGSVPSRANPQGINLFRKYGVNACLLPPELDDGTRTVSDCGVFDELWKLRFWEYPFKPLNGQQSGQGWAENRNMPSQRQQLLLCGYGICRISDMACGEDLFRLLHDITDPAWVDNYRKGY
ncbi:MAG: hypothetical protein ACK4L7_11045 [Flavobacteriales bacterium]